MKCPNCGAEMCAEKFLASGRAWLACHGCGVCAPADVIESLSRRLSPEGVMDEAERLRLERLIASNESAANAINRLVQALERRESGVRVKAGRVRRKPRTVVVDEQAEAAATAALARLKARGGL